MATPRDSRRAFFRYVLNTGVFAGILPIATTETLSETEAVGLPDYTRGQNHTVGTKHVKVTGKGQKDWTVSAMSTQEIFVADGPGLITQINLSLGSTSIDHLKQTVLRAYWDGESEPSFQVPVGDFFGLNLGEYAPFNPKK